MVNILDVCELKLLIMLLLKAEAGVGELDLRVNFQTDNPIQLLH